MAGGRNFTAVVCVIECRNAVLRITELWRQFGKVSSPAPVQQEARYDLPSALPVGMYRGWHVRTAAAALVYNLSSVVRYAPMGCTPTG